MTAISGVEFRIGLLIAASAIALLTKYLRIPYTVALVLGGLLLGLLRLPFCRRFSRTSVRIGLHPT